MDPGIRLNKVINKTIEEKTLSGLNLYFESTPNSSEAFSAGIVTTLLKLLKRDTKDSPKWEELAEDLSKLCEVLFILSATYIKSEALVEKSLKIITAMLNHKSVLADNLMKYVFNTVIKEYPYLSYTKLMTLTFVGSLLQKSSRETRRQMLPSRSVAQFLERLSTFIMECGDYETQVTVVEILARCWIFVKDTKNAPNLFGGSIMLTAAFNKYKFLNFDPECRMFLNELNEEMGDKQLVFSVPCMVVCGDNVRIRKPADEMYKEFWVDFNLVTKSISFYYISKHEEGWELMSILCEHVMHAVATDSLCKSKYGKTILAVKLVLTMKPETSSKYDIPNELKIYPRKTADFEKFENKVLKTLLNEKYKSEVNYIEQATPNQVIIPTSAQKRSIKLNESTGVDANSFVNMSAGPIHTSVLTNPQVSDESESSDIVGPSPSVEISSKSRMNDTDSFTQYIRERKKQVQSTESINETSTNKEETKNSVNHARLDKSPVEDLVCEKILENEQKSSETASKEVEKDSLNESYINFENNLKRQRKTEERVGNFENNSPPLEMEKHNTNSPIKDRSKTSSPHSSSQSQNSSPNSSPKDNLLSNSINQRTLKVKLRDCNLSNTSTKINNQIDKSIEPSKTSVGMSRKRRLYSSENNPAKDIVMSSQSQEDVLSVEVPAYKIKKQHKVVGQQNVNKQNVSYSYISYSKKKNNGDFVKSKNIFLDHTESEEQLSGFKDKKNGKTDSVCKETYNFKYFQQNNRKLLALNKTPESAKESKIFPSETVYSELSASDREARVKRTYSKPRPRRAYKRLKIALPSDSESGASSPAKQSPILHKKKRGGKDSDLDYIPSIKGNVEARKKRQRATKEGVSEGFSTTISRNRVDPIRNITHTTEMAFEPDALEDINVEKRRLTVVQELHVQSVELTPAPKKRGPKKKKAILEDEKVNTPPKRPKGRAKPSAQNKKLKANKDKETAEKLDKDMILNAPVCADTAIYHGCQFSDLEGDDELALELLAVNCPSRKDKELLQTTFKTTDMMCFGDHLLSQVNNKVQKLQSLAQKEREMNLAAFDFKTQSACSALHTLSENSKALSTQIAQAISLLQGVHNAQKENALQIQSEVVRLEEAKEELVNNINKIDKSESSGVIGIFQELGGYIKSKILSLIHGNPHKKALEK